MAEISAAEVFGTVHFLEQLCKELEEVYPQYLPNPADDLALIMYKAGQRSVVEYLITKLED